MASWLPSLISGGASIIGSLLGGDNDKKNREAARKANFETIQANHNFRQEDRMWYKNDRNNERDWSQRLTRSDRAYAEAMRDNEREYAKSVIVDDRVYNNKTAWETRRYDTMKTAKDREYMAGQLQGQRAYDAKMYERDVHKYNHDRNLMQQRSDKYAKATAASRGIDFVKLRDDAVKAGYNPMTALSMAHAYSKQIDYSVQGGVYSPGANYTTGNQGYSPLSQSSGGGGGGVSGGGGAAPGAVMGSTPPAAGNFQASGSGYQAQFSPSMSSGGFIKDAVDRAVDVWSNQRVEKDPLADALRNAFQQDQMADQVRDAQIPKGFGYDLTKQRAFEPAATIGVPSLASAKVAAAPAKMPTGIVQKGGKSFVPVTLPDGSQSTLERSVARRYDIEPFDTLSAGDWEEIRGGVVGELENTANFDKNYETMTGGNFWPVPPSAADYLKSGSTGSSHLGTGNHFNPWAR